MSEQNENVTPGKVEMSPLSEKPPNLGYSEGYENNKHDRTRRVSFRGH